MFQELFLDILTPEDELHYLKMVRCDHTMTHHGNLQN